jgi:hypothetical protein
MQNVSFLLHAYSQEVKNWLDLLLLFSSLLILLVHIYNVLYILQANITKSELESGNSWL